MVWEAFNRMAGESELVLQLLLDGPFKRVRDDNHCPSCGRTTLRFLIVDCDDEAGY